MRLLLFTQFLSNVGGLERTLTDKANFLVERGHDVLIVSYEHEGPLAYPLSPLVQHIDLRCHYFTLYQCPVWRRPLEMLRKKRNFRERFQHVVATFNPDVIVVTIPNTENFIADVVNIAGKTSHIPVVVESHLAFGHFVLKRGATEKIMLYLWNPLTAIKKANLFIALTKGDVECWQRNGLSNVKVVPNPITLYPEQLPCREKIGGRILCVGRLTPQKRFDRVIDAFTLIAGKYTDWHVDIYGEGELHQHLLSRISQNGMEGRIHILVPTPDIYVEYQSSQFFVLSSDYEGFGLVIIEAMSCGIPVVSTDCPYGPSEIIEDGKTGLLVKMDVRDLAAKMEWMITHDDERRQMGLAAHEAAARYKMETVMPMWEKAYQSVL